MLYYILEIYLCLIIGFFRKRKPSCKLEMKWMYYSITCFYPFMENCTTKWCFLDPPIQQNGIFETPFYKKMHFGEDGDKIL